MVNIIGTARGSQYEYHGQSTLPKKGPSYSLILPNTVDLPYQVIDGHEFIQYPYIRIARESRQSIKVTSGELFLFAVGAACIVAGIVTRIWPVALASIGPCLLALVDMFERKSHRTSTK